MYNSAMSDHRQMASTYAPGEIEHVHFLSEDIGRCPTPRFVEWTSSSRQICLFFAGFNSTFYVLLILQFGSLEFETFDPELVQCLQ